MIGAFYYLRIIYYMYFGDEADPMTGKMPALHFVALMGAAAMMLFGVINLFGIEAYAAIAAEALLK